MVENILFSFVDEPTGRPVVPAPTNRNLVRIRESCILFEPYENQGLHNKQIKNC